MDLINILVKHKKFGKGNIVKQEPFKVLVRFSENIGDKIFQYPEGFEKFLELDDESLSNHINTIIAEKKEKVEQGKLEKVNKQKLLCLTQVKKKIPKSLKSMNKNNISIKCNYCNGGSSEEHIGYNGVCSDDIIKYNIKVKKHIWCYSENSPCNAYYNGKLTRQELDKTLAEQGFCCYESKMLNHWKAYAGVVQTGVKKGQAMTFRDLSSNMLAMLTTRLPSTDEGNRVVFAVFIVQGRCEGDQNTEGYIEADPEYRIELSLEEAKQVKFWDYYFNELKPEVIRMGSGLHRYISDFQAAQVLKKIVEVKNKKDEKEYAQKFLDYFCSMKNIGNIPEPEGGLTRQ